MLLTESTDRLITFNESRTVPVTGRRLYIESYGCQMNFSDSEIVASILAEHNFAITPNASEADVVFINTCSIRENAEQRVRNRLKEFKNLKNLRPGLLVGVLGCMAERLKSKFLEQEQLVDLVVGPDAYRDLPRLLEEVYGGQRSVNVLLSREETYADVNPLRFAGNRISAFISIMRGCNNMCSFCVVPFTRGRERSRDTQSILEEARSLAQSGYKEITLLGQNVDSYNFSQTNEPAVNFAALLRSVAEAVPNLRVRFSTSHPKDITNEVLETIAAYPNVCKYIHLPVQSGNDRILARMNRSYTRDWYFQRIDSIRSILGECAISTDIITGFCGETEAEHEDTLSLLERVKFDYAYMFQYSERPGTPAAKQFKDDVPQDQKSRRLSEIIKLQQGHSFSRLLAQTGRQQNVLVEGRSKKSAADLCGRNDGNAMVVFQAQQNIRPGETVRVNIEQCTTATLLGSLAMK